MAERKPAKKTRRSLAKRTTANNKKSTGFTDEEKAAMKERARGAEGGRAARKEQADGESDVLAKIAEMPESDRVMAERLHALDQGQRAGPLAEDLVRDARVRQGRQGRLLLPERGEVQGAGTRRFGFNDAANLDEKASCGRSQLFALTELTGAEEARIGELVERAVS